MKRRSKNTTIAPPRRPRRKAEDDAQAFFSPFQIVENPDWLVGAD